jgi:hypothetical protein
VQQLSADVEQLQAVDAAESRRQLRLLSLWPKLGLDALPLIRCTSPESVSGSSTEELKLQPTLCVS